MDQKAFCFDLVDMDGRLVVNIISSVMASLASPAPLADANGNNDSGYAPSQTDASTVMESPKPKKKMYKKNGASIDTEMK
ncbi:hypothetical protein HHI36_011626 [Cryptolaemus montrouzieri]|uniref:Uncharacterized protein n=1 Tax=Cryptolaemus montrouzieri TaxID=559131 RepID=A0ABD2MME9_9CUCU